MYKFVLQLSIRYKIIVSILLNDQSDRLLKARKIVNKSALMKRPSSKSWLFFDRIKDEKGATVAVQCKLCDNQYKFFGNTTNLRGHLKNIHPLQWELSENGTLDETSLQNIESLDDPPRYKRKRGPYKKIKDGRYSVIIDENSAEQFSKQKPHIQIERVDALDENDLHSETEEAVSALVYESDDNEQEYVPPKKKTVRRIKREVISPPRRMSYTAPRVSENRDVSSPFVIVDNSKKDEYSVFGEYIANKLRKLTESRTKGNIQQLITTILWQAEYGAFDSGETVKQVLWTLMLRPGSDTATNTDNVPEGTQKDKVQSEITIIDQDESDS